MERGMTERGARYGFRVESCKLVLASWALRKYRMLMTFQRTRLYRLCFPYMIMGLKGSCYIC